MTKQIDAKRRYVPGSSRGPRSTLTLLLQMAATMEEEERDALGLRLRELRGRRPQPAIADEIGVTLRAYQAWEGGQSAPAWPNLKKLASFHRVSTEYLLHGDLAIDDEAPSQLDRIEAVMVGVLDRLERLEHAIATAIGTDEPESLLEAIVSGTRREKAAIAAQLDELASAESEAAAGTHDAADANQESLEAPTAAKPRGAQRRAR